MTARESSADPSLIDLARELTLELDRLLEVEWWGIAAGEPDAGMALTTILADLHDAAASRMRLRPLAAKVVDKFMRVAWLSWSDAPEGVTRDAAVEAAYRILKRGRCVGGWY